MSSTKWGSSKKSTFSERFLVQDAKITRYLISPDDVRTLFFLFKFFLSGEIRERNRKSVTSCLAVNTTAIFSPLINHPKAYLTPLHTADNATPWAGKKESREPSVTEYCDGVLVISSIL